MLKKIEKSRDEETKKESQHLQAKKEDNKPTQDHSGKGQQNKKLVNLIGKTEISKPLDSKKIES